MQMLVGKTEIHLAVGPCGSSDFVFFKDRVDGLELFYSGFRFRFVYDSVLSAIKGDVPFLGKSHGL